MELPDFLHLSINKCMSSICHVIFHVLVQNSMYYSFPSPISVEQYAHQAYINMYHCFYFCFHPAKGTHFCNCSENTCYFKTTSNVAVKGLLYVTIPQARCTRDVYFIMSAALPFVNYISHIVKTSYHEKL